MLRMREIENFVPLGNLSRGSFLSSLFPLVPTKIQLLEMYDAYLPAFLDSISRFQYQKAASLLQKEHSMEEWKCWNALAAALLLISACESTYHTMIYLKSAQQEANDSIIRLYTKILVLCDYLKDETRLYVDNHIPKRTDSALPHWEKQFGTEVTSYHMEPKQDFSGRCSKDPQQCEPVDLSTELRLCDYKKLFDQLVKLCELRIRMVTVYSTLGTASAPHNYEDILDGIGEKDKQLECIDHPSLSMIRESISYEMETVKTALECERIISSYDPVRAISALHCVKFALQKWNRHVFALDLDKETEDPETFTALEYKPSCEDSDPKMKSDHLFCGTWTDDSSVSTKIGLVDPRPKVLPRRLSLPDSSPQTLQQCMITKSRIMHPLDEYLYHRAPGDIKEKLWQVQARLFSP
ncbi:hypothetical protein ABG067_001796 [Albugo candida]